MLNERDGAMAWALISVRIVVWIVALPIVYLALALVLYGGFDIIFRAWYRQGLSYGVGFLIALVLHQVAAIGAFFVIGRRLGASRAFAAISSVVGVGLMAAWWLALAASLSD
jgi:hypothetical protein